MHYKTLGNSVSTAYTYDLAGRLESLINYNPEGAVLSRFDYTFDTMGRRTGMSTLDGTWTYTYDRAGRIVLAEFTSTNPELADQSITYTYDKNGNRNQVTTNGSSTGYTTNNMNQYSQAGNAYFKYDADGNLITKTEGSDIWNYTYNADSRLVSISGPEGLTEYQYDGLKSPSKKIKNLVALDNTSV